MTKVNAAQTPQSHCLPQQEAQALGKGENAQFPGGASAQIGQDGTLNVHGGKGNDKINLEKMKDGNYSLDVNGSKQTFDGSQVSGVNINAGKGHDNVRVGHGVDVHEMSEDGVQRAIDWLRDRDGPR